MNDDDKSLLPPQLEIAAIIAPVVRSMKGRKRIHVTKGNTGEVIEVIDDQTLVVKMLERKGVEFGVAIDPTRCVTCKKKLSARTLRLKKGTKAATGLCRDCRLISVRKKAPCSVCGIDVLGSRAQSSLAKGRPVTCDRHRRKVGWPGTPRIYSNECARCGKAVHKNTARAAAIRGGRPMHRGCHDTQSRRRAEAASQ